MYIHKIPLVNYMDPWVSSFEKRLDNLKRGGQRVSYYYEKPDSSTFRYRVYNMIQALQESRGEVSASYFSGGELNRMDEIICNSDVLVVCRAPYNELLSRFITKARNKGKKVFFDIDDLVYNPAYVHLVLDSLNVDFNDPVVSDLWFSYFGRQAATLSLCDQVITTNDYLASCIKLHTGKTVFVIPNFLNREQVDISRKIFNAKKENGFKRDNSFHLGYFSGSPTHTKDLAVALDALVDLLEKHRNLVLRIVGYMDLIKSLQKYTLRIERYPLQDFINLQRVIGDVEVNLVPLQDNEFTNSKSDLKYFEAGIAGTVSVASPTHVFTKSIFDGDNGYLAKSYEWYEKIDMIITQPDFLAEVAASAYKSSEQKYAWYNQTELISKVLFPQEAAS